MVHVYRDVEKYRVGNPSACDKRVTKFYDSDSIGVVEDKVVYYDFKDIELETNIKRRRILRRLGGRLRSLSKLIPVYQICTPPDRYDCGCDAKFFVTTQRKKNKGLSKR